MTTNNLKDWTILAKILRFMSAIFAILAVSFVAGMALGRVIIVDCLADNPLLSLSYLGGFIIYSSLSILCIGGSILIGLLLSKLFCGNETKLFGRRRRQRALPSDAIASLRAAKILFICSIVVPYVVIGASVAISLAAAAITLELFRWFCAITDLLVLVAIVVGVVTMIYLRIAKRRFARLSRPDDALDRFTAMLQSYR